MTPGVRPLIAGNWKMNGTLREAAALAEGVRAGLDAVGGADLLICPPFVHLHVAAASMGWKAVGIGGQDCAAEPNGAHTGDVSAAMLADAGCGYVILGHSERRADRGETDALVRAKAEAAIEAGLIPVVCVGETEAQRDSGEAEAVVAAQMAGSLPEGFAVAKGVVAYEPVWAIGTGRTPTEADIAAMHARMRAEIAARFPGQGETLRLLYGGSVKPSNAAGILALPNVDGALVGGASLKAADFLGIAAAVPA
ncbi:triose-phosphate isomerase [Roseomonas nepalensis]|uniref:Triosephosphate isomerase n=1 Tax=Muricoccus nepalensis TaxID=1854500 RepID=A0A502GI25_9PROT|nr:triose-phosphate isomerase [Roseomonas nepalensis]TPG61222.1 triose-phosphate isomerase [Roseomonas nepalensis]